MGYQDKEILTQEEIEIRVANLMNSLKMPIRQILQDVERRT